MSFHFVVGLAALVLLQACQTLPNANSPAKVAPLGSYSGGDGTSVASAVVIDAPSDASATRTEDTWIQEHYPGARTQRQSLVSHGQHVYDVLEVVLIDDATQRYFFDITQSFSGR